MQVEPDSHVDAVVRPWVVLVAVTVSRGRANEAKLTHATLPSAVPAEELLQGCFCGRSGARAPKPPTVRHGVDVGTHECDATIDLLGEVVFFSVAS